MAFRISNELAAKIAKLYMDYDNAVDLTIWPDAEVRPKFEIDESTEIEIGRGVVYVAKPINSYTYDDPGHQDPVYKRMVFVVTRSYGSNKMENVGYAFMLRGELSDEEKAAKPDIDIFWERYVKPHENSLGSV